MTAARHGSRRLALAFAVVVGLAVAGCVRLSEPTSWACSGADDCEAHEQCSSTGVCVGEGICFGNSDCSSVERCDVLNGRCIAAECHAGNVGVCGNYACVNGVCNRDCTTDNDCVDSFVCAFVPLTGSTRRTCQPRPKRRGETCVVATECSTGLQCCTATKVCGDCFPSGVTCTQASNCDSGLCCPGIVSKQCGSAGYCPPPF